MYKLHSTVDDKVYVGSTINTLNRRRSLHVYHGTLWNSTVYQHFNSIGWDNCIMTLIENYPCANRRELEARERYWYDQLAPSLNMHAPFRTAAEVKEAQKPVSRAAAKRYYERNKAVISVKSKARYAAKKAAAASG